MGFPDLRAYFSLRSSNGILLGKITVLFSGKVICPEKSLRSLSKCYFYHPVHLLFSFHGSVEIPARESSPEILQFSDQSCKSWFQFLCSGDTRHFPRFNRAVRSSQLLIQFSTTKTIPLSIGYRWYNIDIIWLWLYVSNNNGQMLHLKTPR